jgi:hypothetical protein
MSEQSSKAQNAPEPEKGGGRPFADPELPKQTKLAPDSAVAVGKSPRSTGSKSGKRKSKASSPELRVAPEPKPVIPSPNAVSTERIAPEPEPEGPTSTDVAAERIAAKSNSVSSSPASVPVAAPAVELVVSTATPVKESLTLAESIREKVSQAIAVAAQPAETPKTDKDAAAAKAIEGVLAATEAGSGQPTKGEEKSESFSDGAKRMTADRDFIPDLFPPEERERASSAKKQKQLTPLQRAALGLKPDDLIDDIELKVQKAEGRRMRKSGVESSVKAFQYVHKLSQDDDVRIRDTDRSTSFLLLGSIALAVLSLLFAVCFGILGTVACDLAVGFMLLFYVANRFGILNTFTPRQALLTWQLIVGTVFLSVFITINIGLILAFYVSTMK